MRLYLFILLLFTSLCFGVDFNAKTEENRAKMIEFYSNYDTRNATFEKDKNNLWFKNEEFLGYASKKFKDDKQIVWNVIKNNPRFLNYDKKLVLEDLKTNTDSLRYVDKNILKDRDVILYFFKMLDKKNASKYHNLLIKIDPSLLDDEEIMLEAVGKNGMLLQYASKRLRKNKTIVLKAVSENGLALKYADKALLKNQKIVTLALRSNPKVKYYIDNEKNKIKRKVKPQAWECYDINETLERLYGKDRVYEKSKDIDINLVANTEEYFKTSMGPGYIQINSNKKIKSIAILQDKEADRALVALYYPYGNTVNIKLALKILYARLTMGIEGMKVVTILETEDEHLYMNEYTIKYNSFCTQFDAKSMYMDDLKRDLHRNGFKTKYQIDENRVGYLKFQILNTMLNYDEAEKFNVNINFVSHIEGHIKDKKLFDLYTSEYIHKDPLIKMKFENMKQDEGIELSYTTIDGKVKSKYAKPRKMKKKSH